MGDGAKGVGCMSDGVKGVGWVTGQKGLGV